MNEFHLILSNPHFARIYKQKVHLRSLPATKPYLLHRLIQKCKLMLLTQGNNLAARSYGYNYSSPVEFTLHCYLGTDGKCHYILHCKNTVSNLEEERRFDTDRPIDAITYSYSHHLYDSSAAELPTAENAARFAHSSPLTIQQCESTTLLSCPSTQSMHQGMTAYSLAQIVFTSVMAALYLKASVHPITLPVDFTVPQFATLRQQFVHLLYNIEFFLSTISSNTQLSSVSVEPKLAQLHILIQLILNSDFHSVVKDRMQRMIKKRNKAAVMTLKNLNRFIEIGDTLSQYFGKGMTLLDDFIARDRKAQIENYQRISKVNMKDPEEVDRYFKEERQNLRKRFSLISSEDVFKLCETIKSKILDQADFNRIRDFYDKVLKLNKVDKDCFVSQLKEVISKTQQADIPSLDLIPKQGTESIDNYWKNIQNQSYFVTKLSEHRIMNSLQPFLSIKSQNTISAEFVPWICSNQYVIDSRRIISTKLRIPHCFFVDGVNRGIFGIDERNSLKQLFGFDKADGTLVFTTWMENSTFLYRSTIPTVEESELLSSTTKIKSESCQFLSLDFRPPEIFFFKAGQRIMGVVKWQAQLGLSVRVAPSDQFKSLAQNYENIGFDFKYSKLCQHEPTDIQAILKMNLTHLEAGMNSSGDLLIMQLGNSSNRMMYIIVAAKVNLRNALDPSEDKKALSNIRLVSIAVERNRLGVLAKVITDRRNNPHALIVKENPPEYQLISPTTSDFTVTTQSAKFTQIVKAIGPGIWMWDGCNRILSKWVTEEDTGESAAVKVSNFKIVA